MKNEMIRRNRCIHTEWGEWLAERILVLLAAYGLVRLVLDFVRVMVIAAVLIAATQLQAQAQTTYFAVGNDMQANSFAHQIGISDNGNWIICNGKYYPHYVGYTIRPANACSVTKWNAVYGRWDKWGCTVIKSADGTQYLDGDIRVKSSCKTNIEGENVCSSRVKYFVTAQITTGRTTTVKNNVTIYEWNGTAWVGTGTIVSPWINGWIKISPFDGSTWSSYLNGMLDTDFVPAPSGPTPPVMPARVQ